VNDLERSLKDLIDDTRLPTPPSIDELRKRTERRGYRVHQPRRLLVGILTAVVVISGVTLAVVYGPRSSQLAPKPGRQSNLGSPPTRPAGLQLNVPGPLAIASNGDLLVSNQGTNQILERLPDGTLTTFAGNGHAGADGDGGRATSAELNAPIGMAVASDGTVYIADSQNNRIRVVSPTGLITTFAQVADPVALALGPQNTLYIVDQAGVQTVSSNRAVATLLPPPTSVNGIVGDVSVEGEVFAFDPDAITVTPSGDLYLANSSPKVLLRYSSGVMSMVGGTSLETADTYVAQDGLAVAPDGTIIVGDYGGFDLDQVTGTSISPIDKSGLNSIAKLIGGFRPSGVAVGSNGEIYTDTDGRSGATNRETLIAIDPDGKAHLLADDGAL